MSPTLVGAAPIWSVAAPLAGAIGVFLLGPRVIRALVPLAALATGGAVVLAVTTLWREGAVRYPLGGWAAPLGIDLLLDGLAALMLLATAAVGLGATLHGLGDDRRCASGEPAERSAFWALWFLLWAGLNALFLAADIFNLYVTLELLTLAAVALIAMAGGPALAAALRYLLWALAASLVYLMGVALFYAAYGTVDIALITTAVIDDPTARAAALLMLGGLALKAALFPLHFWLPPAHADAPPPVSALLSALVVMAAFYAMLRLWVTVVTGLAIPLAGQLLGGFGAVAVVWGAFCALRQERLKLLVAYSTVAQVGYLFLCFALGAGWSATVYLAVSHACAKAAMFLGAGSISHVLGHDRLRELGAVSERLPLTLLAVGMAGISLIGLPPSGGFVGKWLLLDAAITQGQWWIAAVILVGGLATAGYVFRIIAACFVDPPIPAAKFVPMPVRFQLPAFALAALALLLGLIAPYLLGLLDVGAPFGLVGDTAP